MGDHYHTRPGYGREEEEEEEMIQVTVEKQSEDSNIQTRQFYPIDPG